MKIMPFNANVVLLSKYYELNTSRVNNNAYASIDEVTCDPDLLEANEIASTLRLDPSQALDIKVVYNAIFNSDSRIKLLIQMSKPELMSLLAMLDKEKLLLGLNFFSAAKLLELILRLPKDMLIKALLQQMSIKTLLSMMPQRELLRILNSGKIKESMIIDSIKNLPTHILIQMLESLKGHSINSQMKYNDVLKEMSHLKKRQLLEGLLTLPRGTLMKTVLEFTTKDPSLLTEMSKYAISQPFTRFQKSSLIQSFSVMENSEIIKILGGLPKELLAQVACMIDPGELSQVLISQFPDLLASMM